MDEKTINLMLKLVDTLQKSDAAIEALGVEVRRLEVASAALESSLKRLQRQQEAA